MGAAVLCVILCWLMAAACLGIAAIGRREVASGRAELGTGLIRFGLGLALFLGIFGAGLTASVWSWMAA